MHLQYCGASLAELLLLQGQTERTESQRNFVVVALGFEFRCSLSCCVVGAATSQRPFRDEWSKQVGYFVDCPGFAGFGPAAHPFAPGSAGFPALVSQDSSFGPVDHPECFLVACGVRTRHTKTPFRDRCRRIAANRFRELPDPMLWAPGDSPLSQFLHSSPSSYS